MTPTGPLAEVETQLQDELGILLLVDKLQDVGSSAPDKSWLQEKSGQQFFALRWKCIVLASWIMLYIGTVI